MASRRLHFARSDRIVCRGNRRAAHLVASGTGRGRTRDTLDVGIDGPDGKKSRSKRDKKFRSTSTLDQHKHAGSKLIPPLLGLPNMRPVSWSNDQIPEMLWAALLIADLGRVRALDRFRKIAAFVYSQPGGKTIHDVSHSGLASLDPELLGRFLAVVTRGERYASALTPLLLLNELPAHQYWAVALQHANETKGWDAMMDAVATVFEHQSQEATDCRWLKVLIAVLAGKLHLGAKERVKQILDYPAVGDMRTVRPSIRATEMALRNMSDSDDAKSTWVPKFWQQGYADTHCFGFVEHPIADRPGIAVDTIESLYDEVAQHADASRLTTGTDPKHDVTFGTVLYAITVLHEIVNGRIDGGVLGQVGLRVLSEATINLAYLLRKDDADLWKSFRAYGAGQAKLTFLKFEDIESPPNSISVETLRALANEDLWQEFVPIELGHWEKSNLRKMSDDAGVKETVYDSFYQWPSQFAHAHWGAIGDTIFMNCANPLHRFHRVARPAPRQLPPTVDQAIGLVNRLLELLDQAYPSFGARVVAVPPSNSTLQPTPTRAT